MIRIHFIWVSGGQKMAVIRWVDRDKGESDWWCAASDTWIVRRLVHITSFLFDWSNFGWDLMGGSWDMKKTVFAWILYMVCGVSYFSARRLLIRCHFVFNHLYEEFVFGFRSVKIWSQSDGWIVRYGRNKISALSRYLYGNHQWEHAIVIAIIPIRCESRSRLSYKGQTVKQIIRRKHERILVRNNFVFIPKFFIDIS